MMGRKNERIERVLDCNYGRFLVERGLVKRLRMILIPKEEFREFRRKY